VHYQRLKHKRDDYRNLEIQQILQSHHSRTNEDTQFDDRKFYEHVDRLLELEQARHNMTVEKRLEQERIQRQKVELMRQFKKELESQRLIYQSKVPPIKSKQDALDPAND
jgi:hypothetical protein